MTKLITKKNLSKNSESLLMKQFTCENSSIFANMRKMSKTFQYSHEKIFTFHINFVILKKNKIKCCTHINSLKQKIFDCYKKRFFKLNKNKNNIENEF